MCRRLFALLAICAITLVPPLFAQEADEIVKERQVTLDFNNVDLPVFVKFISELAGKNFIIDERVKGKVTIYSPVKIPVSRAYDVFLSVLELKGFTVVKSGPIDQILPMAEVPPDRSIYVYTLENSLAEEVAKVLLGLTSRAVPLTRRLSPSGELTGAIQVLSDKTTNSLIITAISQDYEILKGVIQKLDTKRRQVYVEAVVLEMAADKFRELGTDLGAVLGYRSSGGGLAAVGTLNIQNPTAILDFAKAAGVTLGKINIQALLRALQSSSDVNILSTPQILTSDNQKAEIVVAQNVPFPGAQSQTVGGNVQTTIERKDVGIILRLTPQVLENDLVKLDLYQEISSVLDTVQSAGTVNLGPTTNKRSASTTVVVAHAQTVVIGGLIRDNVIVSKRKIPLLGDIPFLGWLFKVQSRRIEKTNLLIFLTPHIVRDKEDFEKIKGERTENAALFMEESQLEGRERRNLMFRELVNPPR